MITIPIILRTRSNSLATWVHRGTSDKLVVCLSGIGRFREQPPSYEFAFNATSGGKHSVLFIADPNRTWLNGSGLINNICEEVDTFQKECGTSRTIAAGHSMGGFSALVLPDFLKIDAVLAFAPQLSIHPDVVPDETRWEYYRNRIDAFRIKTVADHFNEDTTYTVISGSHRKEAAQRDRFPRMSNLRRYIVPDTHHNVPQKLKQLGILDKIFHAAIHNQPRKLRLMLEKDANAKLVL